MIKLYNTLSKKIKDFEPINPSQASLYTCGPTVYHFAHIGNLRTYIFEDLLRRVLEYNGLTVTHAMNITDVGHLVGDGDEGEDKMEVGALRDGRHPLEIAKFYTEKFFEDCKALNILPPHEVLNATDAIPEQIEIIKLLEQKGFTYSDDSAIYFDTSKLPDYGKLSGQKLVDKLTGARGDVIVDSKKRHPADFALWFFLTGRYENHILHWPSPWGEGFPGWHIECSAISRKLLGQPFDIHTGGVDHIGTHHTNEIAQSEAAFGMPLAKVWMHGEFLLINAGRMGKSEGNFLQLDSLVEEGFSPMDYRYLCLNAHYRTQLNFIGDSIKSAHAALQKLYTYVSAILERNPFDEAKQSGEINSTYQKLFTEAINDDLNIPKALGIAWKLIDDKEVDESSKLITLLEFDKIFGLGLATPPLAAGDEDLPDTVRYLVAQRHNARDAKDFKKSDDLRKEIESMGYEIMDTQKGQKVKKKL